MQVTICACLSKVLDAMKQTIVMWMSLIYSSPRPKGHVRYGHHFHRQCCCIYKP
jgi:hypothetical protein